MFLCPACQEIDWQRLSDAQPHELSSLQGVLLADLGRDFVPCVLCHLCKLLQRHDVCASQLYRMGHDEDDGQGNFIDLYPSTPGNWQLRAFDFWHVWHHEERYNMRHTSDKFKPPDTPGRYFCLARFETGWYGFGKLLASHPVTFRASRTTPFSEGLTLCCKPCDIQASPDLDSWSLRNRYDPRLVSIWLQEAKMTAWPEMLKSCDSNGFASMRLIDCESGSVVKASDIEKPNLKWIALSYVWRLADQHKVDRQHAQNLTNDKQIPKVVVQAMKVTQDLGYRYLWVDKYCIEQDNHVDTALQISNMDKVYSGAELTIVAASSNGLLPGVDDVESFHREIVVFPQHDVAILETGPSAYDLINKSCWAWRGWTYQEKAMSRQILYFTDTHTLLSNGRSSWTDILPISAPNLCIKSRLPNSFISIHQSLAEVQDGRATSYEYFSDRLVSQGPIMSLYLRSVELYSSRMLSEVQDTIRAFRGVSNLLEMSTYAIKSIQGIPYTSIPEQGALNDTYDNQKFSFTINLCWYPNTSSEDRQNDNGWQLVQPPEFPSWTWAGWKGSNINFYGTRYFHCSGQFFDKKTREDDFKIYMNIVGFLDRLNARITTLPDIDSLDTGQKDGIHYLVLEGFCFPVEEINILPTGTAGFGFENLLSSDVKDLCNGSASLFMMMQCYWVDPHSDDVIISLLVDWTEDTMDIDRENLRVGVRRKMILASRMWIMKDIRENLEPLKIKFVIR
ncbi:heterokaryon incompatibility protein-domain-containing protein [Truncatella angustata]|uniref:Heterokaryon incompatibility protein-domain-containing protein n=1 Tax=Truncatella angustata TaxID=152316 RepID=A0A9P8UMK2_9PEZI|nr:heterokaryon incompatibility protein-domain-containing protein [Truncatella angustata]KAH6654963.1 heterokaryon incompatibility protein-domain-containing protein [Truncatella angustata]